MSESHRPLCFVLMPFGSKPDSSGTVIDFNAVYHEVIAPAIQAAGLQPLRADEEIDGGIIHKAMFERLVLCEYAVADLTTANANVFYELGVRHAARPWSTVLLFAQQERLPFDVSPLRAIPYQLTPEGALLEAETLRARLTRSLQEAQQRQQDSPVYQLVDAMAPPTLDHQKTDLFRERARYSQHIKERLATARGAGLDALRRLHQELEPISQQEAGVVVDLFLSYRAVKAWSEMVALVEHMPAPLARSVMVREQLALALNRAGEGARAEAVLLELIHERGPNSETCGILGRVYKDRWVAAREQGLSLSQQQGLLDKAIAAYLEGFESDWRDYYPGVNILTLMEIRQPPDPRRADLLPIVRYALQRKMARGPVDYWDHATALELSLLFTLPATAAFFWLGGRFLASMKEK